MIFSFNVIEMDLLVTLIHLIENTSGIETKQRYFARIMSSSFFMVKVNYYRWNEIFVVQIKILF